MESVGWTFFVHLFKNKRKWEIGNRKYYAFLERRRRRSIYVLVRETLIK